MRKIKEQIAGLAINAWYLYDGTLCGSPANLARALSIIKFDGPSHGLFLNRAKFLIYTSSTCSVSHPLLHDIPTTSEGFTLLVSPLAPPPPPPPTFCESSVADRVDKIRAIISNLSDLQDAQMETALFQSCFSLPKLAFILCCCPPAIILNALKSFDSLMRETV